MSGNVAFLSTEEIVSHTIRANHEIITNIERAKTAMEDITHSAPDLFGIMTLDGRVVRGNQAVAKIFQVHEEDIFSQNFKSLFYNETWLIIHKSLLELKLESDRSMSIELPFDRINPDRLMNLTFTLFDAVSDRRSQLISFVGKDISSIREYERKLSLIFSSIPLGILKINRDLRIEAPYSAYTELLIGKRNLNGLLAEEVIFGPSAHFMTKQQNEGVKVLLAQIGDEESWFDSARSMFPTELPRGPAQAEFPDSWIGLSYSPLVYNGVVEKLLVIIENISDRVRQRQATAHVDAKEKKIARLIIDLEEANPVLLATCMEDMDAIFSNIFNAESTKKSARSVCNSLHGMKGVARTVNLSRLKDLIHRVERNILAMMDGTDSELTHEMRLELETVKAEWDEVKRYMRVVNPDEASNGSASKGSINQDVQIRIDQGIQLIHDLAGRVPPEAKEQMSLIVNHFENLQGQKLSAITSRLEAFLKVTATRLKKEAAIECVFDDVNVDEEITRSLIEIFYHLLSNALDHGIETPEVRAEQQKALPARIIITGTRTGRSIYFSVTDDGRGINTDKVLAKAIEKGLIAPGSKMTQEAIWQFCIASELSTAKTVTETSGRGIGLNAVDEKIRRLGGKGLTISWSEQGKGARFEFSIDIKGAVQ